MTELRGSSADWTHYVISSNNDIIEKCVSEACITLFTDYSLPLERMTSEAAPAEHPLLFCGVIGFSGDQMRGTMLLATSKEPLGRTSPSTDASLREWLAELANQLLGRVKNRLFTHGVHLHMSTPIVLRGEHISPVSQAELVPFSFVCDGGVVCVWFDVDVTPGVDLTQSVETESVAAEGTGFLF
jgi:CheY-specific phosphatase CheX